MDDIRADATESTSHPIEIQLRTSQKFSRLIDQFHHSYSDGFTPFLLFIHRNNEERYSDYAHPRRTLPDFH